jgi:hypothetical protein
MIYADEVEDLDEELQLPPILSGLSLKEKKALLVFKNTHNEREFEEEIDRHTQPLAKKKELAALKSMMEKSSAPSHSQPAHKPPQAATRKKRTAKRDLSDGESDEDVAPAPKHRKVVSKVMQYNSEEEAVDIPQENSGAEEEDFKHSSDEDDEDLFGSEEEAEISNRPSKTSKTAAAVKGKGGKVLGKGRKAAVATRSSKPGSRDQDENSVGSELEEAEEEEDEVIERDADMDNDDDDLRFEYNLQSIKDSHRRASLSVAASKPTKVFDSLTALRTHLQDKRPLALEAEPDDDQEAELVDYLKIYLRRDEIARRLEEPFFDAFVTGAFVRVTLGIIPAAAGAAGQGEQLYRMCQVVGVERNQRADKLPGSVSTSTRLCVRIGREVKERQRISLLSNHTLTQREFEHYQHQLRRADMNVLTKRDARLLRAQHKQLNGHVYSHAEVDRMVSLRRGQDKSLVTEYSTAMELLLKRREEAKVSRDYDQLESVNKMIERLEREDHRQREVYELTQRKQVDVNRRMKASNVQRDMAAGKRKQEALLAGGGADALSHADPFIRRETRPKILWNTGKKLHDENSAAAAAVEGSKDTTAAAALAKDGKGSSVAASKRDEDAWLLSCSVDIVDIRRKIKALLGAAPVEKMEISKKDCYLRRLALFLPAKGSAERERLRGGNKSLEEYNRLMNMRQPAEA